MTQVIVQPVLDYKILIPKTTFPATTNPLVIDTTAFSFKAVQLLLGVKKGNAASFGTNFLIRPSQSGNWNISTETKLLTGIAPPTIAYSAGGGQLRLTAGLILGTDAAASEFSYFDLKLYNCDLTVSRYGILKGINFAVGLAGSNETEVHFYDLSTQPMNGFQLDTLGATFDAASWYQVNKIG